MVQQYGLWVHYVMGWGVANFRRQFPSFFFFFNGSSVAVVHCVIAISPHVTQPNLQINIRMLHTPNVSLRIYLSLNMFAFLSLNLFQSRCGTSYQGVASSISNVK